MRSFQPLITHNLKKIDEKYNRCGQVAHQSSQSQWLFASSLRSIDMGIWVIKFLFPGDFSFAKKKANWQYASSLCGKEFGHGVVLFLPCVFNSKEKRPVVFASK
jgi:hypothetical protein